MLTAGAILIYVVGYTMILKRRTPQNIVWGGAAGCMPVLIGWSAVTGTVGWPAVLLFGGHLLLDAAALLAAVDEVPPRLRRRGRADAPPVVAQDTKVAREMIGYTLAMIACSLLLVPPRGG